MNNKIVLAEVRSVGLDTTIEKSVYRQSRKVFLEKYGKDDSTKALINYYFSKRGSRLIDAISPVLSGSLLLVATTRNQNVNNTKDGYFNLVVVGPLILFTIGFTANFIVQEVKRTILTKRKLFIIIDNYNHSIHLPKRITRKRRYKIELDKVHGIQPQFKLF